MRYKFSIIAVLLVALAASAQVASHAPTLPAKQPSAASPATGKPVARVNGATLTDRDLLREMYSIFPYARQHNGFPKSLEAEIRKGALDMLIFEELVYQDAERRKIAVTPAELDRAAAALREQFPNRDEYQRFLQTEFKGSQQLLRKQIRRSLLIEALLKNEVDAKSTISLTELKAYYEKNPKTFEYPESFAIQTISFIPPEKATPEQLKGARKQAEAALPKAKAAKTYEEFGMLAEKISQDDYRVMMGDHKIVGREDLPPAVVQAALQMQPGQVSDLIQVEQAYTILRLNAHTVAGKKKFVEVKDSLRKQLQKKKINRLRADLDKKLRERATVELL